MNPRKPGATKSDDSGDYCTISEDVDRLEALKAQSLSLAAPNFQRGFAEWEGARSLENLQANLLSDDFRQRLKQSLEHFTQQHQEQTQRTKPDGRPDNWEESEEATRSRSFQSPVASLATMGPAARQLAQMIHASQQRQHHIEYNSQWGPEEERPAPPNPWMQLPYPQQYPDYWRAQAQAQQGGLPLPWEPSQVLQQGPYSAAAAAAAALGPPQTSGPTAWPPKSLPFPALSHTQAANMDPSSQAELNQSIQMLHEAQRLSAIASCRIQEVYQTANNRKRKGDPDDDKAVSDAMLASGQQAQTLHSLFPLESEQKCKICGTTNTPVWRRVEKDLVCNACGLRKRRSMRRSKETVEQNMHHNLQQAIAHAALAPHHAPILAPAALHPQNAPALAAEPPALAPQSAPKPTHQSNPLPPSTGEEAPPRPESQPSDLQ